MEVSKDQSQSTAGNGKYQPVIPASSNVAEVTTRALVLGAIISVVFGIANAYLGLNFGMTVSSSIPAAVISMAVLRTLFKRNRPTVLENNIVQTVGSAGESLAAGIIFTIPAFFIWAANEQLVAQGYFHEVTKWQIFWLSMLGGSLGILLMIPLRKYLVDREHGNLRFPEGTACAEIIVAGDEGGGKAKMVFAGIGLGGLFKVGYEMLRFWPQTPEYNFTKFLKGGTIGIDATPALLGVGYIIGPRIAGYMLCGSVLGYLAIAPLLAYIGDQIPGVIIAPGTIPLSDMGPSALRGAYIKYLGVGAVAVGGLISLLKSMPVIWTSFNTGFAELLGKRVIDDSTPRTDRDLPMKWVLLAVVAVIIGIWLFLSATGVQIHLLSVAMVVFFGFLFVVVAARIVGIVGSSSSPVSGMTIATLLASCLLLMQFGVEGVAGMVTAMSIGTVVCIAVCMSGDIAQDLKTGFLLGATPRKQQWTEFVGLLFPALAMGFTLFLLNDSHGFVVTPEHQNPMLAPQANIMATVVKGMMFGDLPWVPILIGGVLALAVELLGVPSLPVAIGLYLPLSLQAALMSGGLISMFVGKRSTAENLGARNLRGILFASGLVAGDALIGVFVAGMMMWPAYRSFYDSYQGMMGSLSGSAGPWVSLAIFGAFALILGRIAMRGFGKRS